MVAEQLADLHLDKPLRMQQGAPLFGEPGAGREALANGVSVQPISVGAVSKIAMT